MSKDRNNLLRKDPVEEDNALLLLEKDKLKEVERELEVKRQANKRLATKLDELKQQRDQQQADKPQRQQSPSI